jgi:hypothetical protein
MARRLWLLLLFASTALAQTFTGSIRGRVTDPSGAALPGATVTVTETATSTAVRTVTNETGDYTVSFLKPGVYRVSIAAAGFKESVDRDVILQLNQSLRIDKTMELGASSETVEISATTSQLNYESPEIGHVVGEQQLLNVPLAATNSRGRSLLLLAKLIPGVTSTSSNNSNINNFSFGGGRPVTNEILVDGLPTTNPSDQTYTLTPSPDAIQEFKVITTPFSAEWGHTGGGVMLLTSKRGTNNYHGSVYDFFRNRVLNGRTPFQPVQSQVKYVQNDPGFTFGGPVRLPGYNGKNRTFFFVDWNVTLASNGTLFQGFVPTARERAGDFSQTFNASGQLIQIFDPANTRAGLARDPFPGNVIPASRIDPVAREIVKFYPDTNASATSYNYYVTPPQLRQTWQWLWRIDHDFGPNDKAFVRMGRYNPNGDAQLRIPNKANNDTAGGFRDTQVAISETHVFGPRVVNDFRFGFVQEVNYTIPGGEVQPAPELGLKGVTLDTFPIVQVSGGIGMIQLGASAFNSDRDRSFVFSEALNWQRGRHTLRMGGDYRRQMYNFYNPGKLSGTYSFNGTFTRNAGNNATGLGIADLLLGMPATTTININDYTFRLNINSGGMYLQDDFKVTSRLTLNLGLRWEYDGPYSEANNQFASFNPKLVNRTTGNLGEVEFAGRNGAPEHFVPNIYHNFLPRFGFAWGVLRNTVVRGGYGIYRLPAIGFSGFGPVSQYGQSATFTSLDSGATARFLLGGGVPAVPFNVDANGLPNIPASLTNPTSNVTALETRVRTPYNQSWQFGIQQQLGRWFAEVDYVATKGTKLPVLLPLNQLRPDQFGPGNRQSLRPFPQYNNVSMLANDGNSNWHSLQAKLEHRWHGGLLVSAAYTFSKLINDVDAPARSNGAPIQNAYNLRAERGIGGYDVPQRFVTNFVYALPFGRDGRYLAHLPVLREVIGGWQVAGITEFQVGLPIQITQANNSQGANFQRPNQVEPAALGHFDRTIDRWFNTNAMVTAPVGTLGNAPRFALHGPGLNNTDLAIMRNFHLYEAAKLQFRAEFFNAFNHPQLNNPNTAIGNSLFGRVTAARDPRTIEFALRIFF